MLHLVRVGHPLTVSLTLLMDGQDPTVGKDKQPTMNRQETALGNQCLSSWPDVNSGMVWI